MIRQFSSGFLSYISHQLLPMNFSVLKLSVYIFFAGVFVTGCKAKDEQPDFKAVAEAYTRLGLCIGQYDSSFVDAYYGPDSLRPKTQKQPSFPKDSLLAEVQKLKSALMPFISDTIRGEQLNKRARWMERQLTAFSRRIQIYSGSLVSFDEESMELFGVSAPVYSESHYQALVATLDSLLPGNGSVADRAQEIAEKFIVPRYKVDTVFKVAIAEARKRTLAHYKLPPSESFRLEYVSNKSWSGYNWYKGNFSSLIQINLDLPIYIDRAIDLSCHEGYPGHHVYNMLLEKNLFLEKGWTEISLYPLFSPQSLIAEGSANYGIELAFPGNEKVQFLKEVLLPLAGLDTAGIAVYYKIVELKVQLNYARNEAARGVINGTMNETEATKWLTNYCLMSPLTAKKSIAFLKTNRSYVITYNYGRDLVKDFIEKHGTTGHQERWDKFGWLLSNPVSPSDLLER
jgi:hypothetical protein